MNKKLVVKIVKIVLIVLIIFLLIYGILWVLSEAGFVKKSFIGRILEDGYGEDPCYHEPHEPDPCGGS